MTGDTDDFDLPTHISDLITARNRLRDHYYSILEERGCEAELKFTFDGNLVGDLGEALALHLFGITLIPNRSSEGIDGRSADGRTVQVKATGTGRGPAFRLTKVRADHLLFFQLNFEECRGTILFNGPEWRAFSLLPESFAGQRSLSARQIAIASRTVLPEERLPRIR